MRDVGLAAVGFAVGWLTSKAWQDPGCQLGLVVFLVLGALMLLVFALAVVGHGRKPGPPDDEEEE